MCIRLHGLLLTLSVIFAAVTAAAAEEEARGKEPPSTYDATEPAGMDVLSDHLVIARYDGAPFRRCMGATGLCPQACGGSGQFATFKTEHYLRHEKKGKHGDGQKGERRVRISDFFGLPVGDEKLLACIARLEKGDLVVLHWKHLYGPVDGGGIAPLRPILHLRKVTRGEADRLRRGGEMPFVK